MCFGEMSRLSLLHFLKKKKRKKEKEILSQAQRYHYRSMLLSLNAVENTVIGATLIFGFWSTRISFARYQAHVSEL